MTHQEFLSRKDFYIGKQVEFDEGFGGVIEDIKIGDKDWGENFLCIYVKGGKRPLGGCPDGCHINEYVDRTSVSIMYCGGFDIIH